MRTKTNDFQDFRTELLKDLIFPARCPICSDAIPLKNRLRMHGHKRAGVLAENAGSLYDGLICRECVEKFSYIGERHCRKCGKQLAVQNETEYCRDCAEKERLFVQCRCLISYDETARDLMAEIKYNSKKEYLDIFAVMAADRLGAWFRQVGVDCIVPVPVHRNRLRMRGYNQAEVLADRLSRLTGIPVNKDILIRSKNTIAQKELGADQRLMNLQNAFAAAGRAERKKTYLIVDDIYTTGSTMEACTECLLAAGAEKVYGLCVCAGEDTLS